MHQHELNILLNRTMFSDSDDIQWLMSTGYDYEMMLPTIKDAVTPSLQAGP